jgi:hypothetical protein
VDGVAHRLNGCLGSLGPDVLVDRPGDRRRGVSEQFGHVQHVNARLEAIVANECLAPWSVILGSPASRTSRPNAAETVGGSSGSPISSSEYHPMVRVGGSGRELLAFLLRPVSPERLQGHGGQGNLSAAPRRLRFLGHVDLAVGDPGLLHMELRAVQIDV